VRFRIEQLFATDPITLCAALVDPNYLAEAMARLPDIAAPVIESQVRSTAGAEPTVRQSLRYAFNGKLPSVVTRVISTDRLQWIEDTTIHMTTMTAVFRITPVHYASFFTCSGTWAITAKPDGAGNSGGLALRVLDGTLKVNSPVPFVGGQVEKAIVSGLRERLEKEPAAFNWWLSQR
jgi:Protein of unknown function (DUF2505)